MEPVEINAGACYLRAFRADDRLDDRPALVEAFADAVMRKYVPQYTVGNLVQAGEYIEVRAKGWADDDRCTWAIAEPTTGVLIGEVGLKNLASDDAGVGEAAIWIHPGARRRGVAAAALGAAVRFGFGAVDLTRVDYVCDDDNTASAALAARCGFTHVGPTTSLNGTPSQLWSLSP